MSVLHYYTTYCVPMSLPHCTMTTTLYVVVVLVTGRVNSNLGNIYYLYVTVSLCRNDVLCLCKQY